MLAICAPLMASNVSVPTSTAIAATDASLGKGAIVVTEASEELAHCLWLGSDKKGGYSKLQSGASAALAALGEEGCEVDPEEVGEVEEDVFLKGPYKAPLMYYDFVELFGGAGVVSRFALEMGLVVAPPLDLSASKHYDLTDLRLLEWVMTMVEQRRFKSMMIEPVCTMLRSYAEPLGFDRNEVQTLNGNIMAFFSFVLVRWCMRYICICLLEQPRRSKMIWTRFWKSLVEAGCDESIIAFGSIHQKEFKMLHWGLSSERLTRRCPGGHTHVKIEGKFTKPSAVYVDDLGKHLAGEFVRGLAWRSRRIEDGLDFEGHESLVVNDLLAAGDWKEKRSWHWKGKSHINVLEGLTVVSALKQMAVEEPDRRSVFLVDSRVVKGALSKGRSSSHALQRVCRKACCWQAVGGLYPGLCFAPTRLNVADDPTRDVELRPRCPGSLLNFWSLEEVKKIHTFSLRRPFANWIRLSLLLILTVPSEASSFCCPVSLPCHEEPDLFFASQVWLSCCLFSTLIVLLYLCFDFSFSHHLSIRALYLGFHRAFAQWIFPLSGLSRILGFSYLPLLSKPHSPCQTGWIELQRIRKKRPSSSSFSGFPLRTVLLVSFFVCVQAMEPVTAWERQRALARIGVELVPTRVARKETLKSREKLLGAFACWFYQEHAVSVSILLSKRPPDAEELCKWLVEYGKALFLSGKAYNKYAETINAIAGARPIIRKQLTEAWDLAFAWLADEPFQHHPAMPLTIMLSMVAVALLWGWPLEASVIALTWSGILRVGEVLMAQRSDLILPTDMAPGSSFALLRIKRPKTRGRAAKHQSARVDPADVVRLLTATYGRLPRDSYLWPFSAATLRKRFGCLLRALDLPSHRENGIHPYDLGSLRPGGATHLLVATEDGELVRRRGRWLSIRVMEIYLQEVQSATYADRLSKSSRAKVEMFSAGFETVLKQAVAFLDSAIPTKAWHSLYQKSDVHGAWCGS